MNALGGKLLFIGFNQWKSGAQKRKHLTNYRSLLVLQHPSYIYYSMIPTLASKISLKRGRFLDEGTQPPCDFRVRGFGDFDRRR
jgi:hypothetical protein